MNPGNLLSHETIALYQATPPKADQCRQKISPVGYIECTPENLIYLDVDDDYVHTLLPLLHNKLVHKPNYFEDNMIGAHISVIYPEETRLIKPEDMEQEHHFTIQDVYTAELNAKQYFVVMIESPSLVEFRRRYGLSDQPTFKNHLIRLHITIGVL